MTKQKLASPIGLTFSVTLYFLIIESIVPGPGFLGKVQNSWCRKLLRIILNNNNTVLSKDHSVFPDLACMIPGGRVRATGREKQGRRSKSRKITGTSGEIQKGSFCEEAWTKLGTKACACESLGSEARGPQDPPVHLVSPCFNIKNKIVGWG